MEKIVGDHVFVYEGEVRDNETDLQGIVNHANYFIYMAHCRHLHIKSLGIDFSEMHQKGYNLVLIHADVHFRASLSSGDCYRVTSQIQPKGKLRFVFSQEVIRQRDGRVVVQAQNTATGVEIATGKPKIPVELREALVYDLPVSHR